MKITAIIPAKGSSDRLENKNLLKVNGKSLTELCCSKLLLCKKIDEVYLDTESEKIISDVQHLFSKGLKLIRRPVELANNSITANDLLVFALHSIPHTDLILQTFVTSPLITTETIDQAIVKFLSSNSHDAFLTVQEIQEYFWDAQSQPMNFDINILPNSSDLNKIYMETHGLYGIYTDSLLENKNRFGEKTMMIPISKLESLDINDYDDFQILTKLLEI